MRTLKIALIFVLLLSACSPVLKQQPNAKLLAAQKTFVAVVNSLTILQNAGKFSTEETEQIAILIHSGEAYLIEWENALKDNKVSSILFYIEGFNIVLQALVDYQLAKGT
jgi:hypothetical protein